LSRRHDCLSW